MSRDEIAKRRVIALVCAVLGAAVPVRAEVPISDPTRPELVHSPAATTARPATSPLALHAILYGGGRRLAVVNGQRVGVGDFVEGGEVLAIAADHVRLRRGSETFELELVSPVFRQMREQAGPNLPSNVQRGTPADPARRGSLE